MNIHLGAAALMFVAVLMPSAAAQNPSALLQAGRKAVAAKDCAGALRSFQAALDASEKPAVSVEHKAAVQQEALREIAECHTTASNWDAAETALWRRKEVLAQWTGPRELELGHTMQSVAYIQIQRERWTFAERYAREALAAYDAALKVAAVAGGASEHSDGKKTAKRRESPAARSQAHALEAANRSRVAAFYTLGLALALQRRTDDALAAWDQGFRLGESFKPPPDATMQIVVQAIDLHDMTKRTAGRAVWVERLRKLRSPR